jgi:hypothetical protein
VRTGRSFVSIAITSPDPRRLGRGWPAYYYY